MTIDTNETTDSNKMNQGLFDVNQKVNLPPKISKIPLKNIKEIESLQSEIKGLDKDFRKKKSNYKLMKASGEKESKLNKMKIQLKSIKSKKSKLNARLQAIKSQFSFL